MWSYVGMVQIRDTYNGSAQKRLKSRDQPQCFHRYGVILSLKQNGHVMEVEVMLNISLAVMVQSEP